MNDVSRFLRPVTLEEILASEKRVRTKIFAPKKKSKVYPLWQCRFMSFPEEWLTFPLFKGGNHGTALVVGLILWQQYRLNRCRQPLKLTGHMRRKFSLNRSQVRRALITLEKAGLVTVQRFRYRSPLITLVTGQILSPNKNLSVDS
jgi:DNA-binding transcriptional ArsR family regulator